MSQLFLNKRIVLGVCGSISCYKAVTVASQLTQLGAQVDVILTDSAEKFVTPLTFRSVTGRPAYDDMWDEREHVPHVGLGENADLLVIAPATAHTIGKLAQGMADNLLTVTALAARCPVLLAPAMDGGMYTHPAVQANVETLQKRGVTLAGPASGRMASGLVGLGRLVEPNELIIEIGRLLAQRGPLAGKRVVVTAGPTEEPIDPVRYITNRSSGKQGIAVAEVARDLGAEVTLIAGPISVSLPLGINCIKVQTAQQMHDAVLQAIESADVLVMSAAVADFRPQAVATQKIKKDPNSTDAPTITLTRNPDILQSVRQWRENNQNSLFVVGFAAETENVIEHGISKLHRKGLDLIAINDVSHQDRGFGVDSNEMTLIGKQGVVATLPLQRKVDIAEKIWYHLMRLIVT